MTYVPPQSIDPAALRPARTWYWIAGAVALLGVCVGAGLAIFGFASLRQDIPKMKATFAESTTVTLAADKKWAIYADDPSSRGASAAPPSVECTGEGADGGGIDITSNQANFNYTSGNHQWHLVYEVSVDSSGEYRIECSSDDEGVQGYAVGTAINIGGVVGKTFGSLGALCGIPCLAFFIAGGIALITAVRRSSHRKRLERDAAAGGVAGYPGYSAPPPQPGPPPPPGTPPPGPPPA